MSFLMGLKTTAVFYINDLTLMETLLRQKVCKDTIF
jgi:hypothetical protein